MYQNENGKSICLKCAKGRFSSRIGQDRCFDCTQGYFQNLSGSSFCRFCEQGMYSLKGGASSCLHCGNGSETMVSFAAKSCKACRIGKFSDELSVINCKDCSIGKYESLRGKTICITCLQGSITGTESTGASKCHGCSTGKFSTRSSNVSCETCYPGSATGKNIGASTCIACAAGRYSTVSIDFCILCAAGKYGTKTGRNAERISCDSSCEIGKYKDLRGQSTNNCIVCAKGSITKRLGVGAFSCSACGVGKYAKDSNILECIQCRRGSYMDKMGRSRCKSCTSGLYSRSKGNSICKQCGRGSEIKGSPGTSCRKCDKTFFADKIGTLQCKKCPNGKASNPDRTDCVSDKVIAKLTWQDIHDVPSVGNGRTLTTIKHNCGDPGEIIWKLMTVKAMLSHPEIQDFDFTSCKNGVYDTRLVFANDMPPNPTAVLEILNNFGEGIGDLFVEVDVEDEKGGLKIAKLKDFFYEREAETGLRESAENSSVLVIFIVAGLVILLITTAFVIWRRFKHKSKQKEENGIGTTTDSNGIAMIKPLSNLKKTRNRGIDSRRNNDRHDVITIANPLGAGIEVTKESEHIDNSAKSNSKDVVTIANPLATGSEVIEENEDRGYNTESDGNDDVKIANPVATAIEIEPAAGKNDRGYSTESDSDSEDRNNYNTQSESD
eukprot:g1190.t1